MEFLGIWVIGFVFTMTYTERDLDKILVTFVAWPVVLAEACR
jgi:hypothetical protein